MEQKPVTKQELIELINAYNEETLFCPLCWFKLSIEYEQVDNTNYIHYDCQECEWNYTI